MGYVLAIAAMILKLALAACLASDGDALGALVVAILSPSLFLIASDPRRARGQS